MAKLKVVGIDPKNRGRNGQNDGSGVARLEGTDGDGRKLTARVTFEAKDADKYFLGADITV